MAEGAIVFVIFVSVAAAAVTLMLLLANAGARKPLPQSIVTARGYAVRRWWFATVLVVAVAAFAATIPRLPYPRADELRSSPHFTVVAQQYSFVLPATVPVNTAIVFDVTSRDVNHGFGIYDPAGHVVGQVQAMPDYVNHLPMRFERPGHYTVRCLEFCGVAHAAMQGAFEVR
ncbi:MAG TPA: hypothetical protein VN905_03630 [Candidatus Binatia bacterium]|nr:hypothetical protein [Candidatus Binatia bacterium]